jgi:hypothetical protein
MFSLNKKTAVITGAAGGIGFAIAIRFRAAGAAKGGLEPILLKNSKISALVSVTQPG